MAENHKHQKVIKQYNQYKNIILRWENTMSKLEGRKPDKNDFENAPKEVKDAYKHYHKCKRYITKLETDELKLQQQQASKKSTTPRKIFGGFQSQSFIRASSTSNITTTSSSSFSHSTNNKRKDFLSSIPAPIKKNPIIKTFSQKLFSIPSVELSKNTKKLSNKSISNDSVGNDSKTSSSSVDNSINNSNNNSNNNTFEDSINNNEQQQDENIELDTEISDAVLSYFEEQNSSLVNDTSTNDATTTMDSCSSSSYFATDISGIDSMGNEDFNSSSCSMGEHNNTNDNIDVDMNTSTATTATTNFDNSISLDTSDIFTPCSSFIKSFSINQVSSNSESNSSFTRQKYGNLLKLDDDDVDEVDLSFNNNFSTPNNNNNNNINNTNNSKHNLSSTVDFDTSDDDADDTNNISVSSTANKSYNTRTRRVQKTKSQVVIPMEMSASFSEDEEDIMTKTVKIPTSVFDIDHEPNMTNDDNNMTFSNVSPTTTTTTTESATTNNTDNNCSRKRTSAHAFSPSPEKVQPKKKFFKSDRKGSDKRYSLKSCLTLPMNTNKRQRKTNTNSTNTNKIDDETIGIIETENKSLESLKITLRPDVSSPGSFKVRNKSRTNKSTTVENSNTSSTSPSTSIKSNNEPSTSRTTSLRSSRNKTTINYNEEMTTSTKTKTNKKMAKVVTTSKKSTTTTTKKVATSKKSASSSTKKKSESTSTASKKPTATATTTTTTANSNPYDDDYAPENSKAVKRKRGRRGFMSTTSKIASGRIDDNFVRIDVSKKVFVRGKKKMTGAKMKRLDWKVKKSVASRESKLSQSKCRKCGELGHFSKFCMKDQIDGETESTNLSHANAEVDDSPWPTVEEAAKMAWSKRATGSQDNRTSIYARCDSNMIAQDLEHANINSSNNNNSNNSFDVEDTQASCSSNNNINNINTMPTPEPKVPIFVPSCGPYFDNKTTSDEELDQILEKTVKDIFGYEGFRDGQKETIIRVLKGEASLLISSTGSGKSLCYQLPAYLYSQKYPDALTLCISPLVSLMDDQVEGLPGVLNGIALHCQMTAKKREQYIDQIKNKKAQILLASPEAVASGLFGLLRNGQLPPIAFACIDEVHCVSEWSHNFRPTYLELCKILREKLSVKCILGLTATATAQTEVSICEHLQIDRSTVLRGEIIPRNLNLSVSRDQDRDLALLHLLRSERFRNCQSIIVYCTTREQCDKVAVFIRTNIQDIPQFNTVIPIARSRISSNCEVYHSRITAARRRYVQKHFMAGNIRIVVATIAFGMGIDKSDIRAVIHYNMSKTFELYVQEIGRAGRDGLPGECHLFLDNIKGKDLSELKRHIYSNSVDRATVRSLLRRIFRPCKCNRIKKLLEDSNSAESDGTNGTTTTDNERCPGHEVAFSSEDMVRDLDLPTENIATLLCYLELEKSRKWIENLPMTYAICKIHSYGGSKLLKEAALKCPPLAVAVALQKEKKKFKDTDVYLEFNLVEAASEVGWSSSIVKKEIKNLEWTPTQFDAHGKPIKYRKSGILVEFTTLSYRVKAPGDLTDEELDGVLNYLYGVNSEQERTQLYNLYKLYQSFYSVSSPNVISACDTFNKNHSETLKGSICEYFKQEGSGVPPSWKLATQGTEKEDDIRRDISNLLLSQRDTTFTGRSIAKILQGIPSPNFSSDDWGRNRAFWRRYMDVDFHFLSKIASEEILKYN